MTTITIPHYNDFGNLSIEEATAILYNELVPACEIKGVLLSSYGNHAGHGSLDANRATYAAKKEARTLFDVNRVQALFRWIPNGLKTYTSYKRESYGLKHSVEKAPGQSYTSNGDLIAACLLRGHSARFGKRGQEKEVNCEFKLDLR